MVFRFWSNYKIIEVVGESMSPTLRPNWKLLFKKINVEYVNYNDIILFHYNSKLMIKRIIGLPGDYVEIGEGELIINEQRVIEDYIETPRFSEFISKWQIKQNEYVLLGDNSMDSLDSRKLGPITFEDEIYILKRRLWPFLLKSNKSTK